MQTVNIPPALAALAAGRDHILTAEFCHVVGCVSQTARKNHGLTGHCFGVHPVKVGNKLLWPVAEIAALLNGGK